MPPDELGGGGCRAQGLRLRAFRALGLLGLRDSGLLGLLGLRDVGVRGEGVGFRV